MRLRASTKLVAAMIAIAPMPTLAKPRESEVLANFSAGAFSAAFFGSTCGCAGAGVGSGSALSSEG